MRFMHMHLITSIHRSLLICSLPNSIYSRYLNQGRDIGKFRETLKSANNVVFISGDGISAESGLPIFGSGGNWRKYQASSLATKGAFLTFPSLVWEFYHYRREIAANAEPNDTHTAIAEFEKKYEKEKSITVITQTIDGLHARAGTKNLIELYGSLFKTRCIKCNDILVNNDSPICAALKDRGSPQVDDVHSSIPVESLPHCAKSNCDGLLRPHIVWYGEGLEPTLVEKAEQAMSKCDVCLVIGRSSLMFPAAIYASEAANRGTTVAEFDTEPKASFDFHYYFEGPYSKMIPEALAI